MKKLKYVLFLAVTLMAISCTEQNITPRDGGDDDPINIPPPPPPPNPPPHVGG